MSVKKLIKKALPPTALGSIRDGIKRVRSVAQPPLSEESFTELISTELAIGAGDTVFVHSSIDQLDLEFPFYRILKLLQHVVGPTGTLLFPTYPRLSSYDFLSRNEVFDVRKTPSYTGVLTEFARRQAGALRSLHPTKSVCAIGPNASLLTKTHQDSPYPYDRNSPYYKLIEVGAKIIGLGVSTSNLSFVHCADDALKADFPVQPYVPQLFEARCIDREGKTVVVKTFAHDLSKMDNNIPRYMRTHISPAACRDLRIKGRKFFIADAKSLFEAMLGHAKQGVTIYKR